MLKIIDEIRPDCRGNFTVEQFQSISLFNPVVDEYSLKEVMGSLTIFDEDSDGKLTVKELMNAMTKFGEKTEDGGTTQMNVLEFDLMRTRLQNFGLIDSDGMIDIEKMAMTFLEGVERQHS